MTYITIKETKNAAGRAIPAGSQIEVHKSEVNKFIELGIIAGFKIKSKKQENAMAKQTEKETR